MEPVRGAGPAPRRSAHLHRPSGQERGGPRNGCRTAAPRGRAVPHPLHGSHAMLRQRSLAPRLARHLLSLQPAVPTSVSYTSATLEESCSLRYGVKSSPGNRIFNTKINASLRSRKAVIDMEEMENVVKGSPQ